MKKSRKRLSALLLALVMIFSLLPLSAWAAEPVQAEEPRLEEAPLTQESKDGELPLQEEPVPEEPILDEDSTAELMANVDTAHNYVRVTSASLDEGIYTICSNNGNTPSNNRICYHTDSGSYTISWCTPSSLSDDKIAHATNYNWTTQAWKITPVTNGYQVEALTNSGEGSGHYLNLAASAIGSATTTTKTVTTITYDSATQGYKFVQGEKSLVSGGSNFSLGATAGAATALRLYKQTEIPPEPAPTIPGYTVVTDTTNLDTTKLYIIVSKDSSGNFYALYPNAAGKDFGCGNLSQTAGTMVAKLTVTNDTVSATNFSGAALDMSALHLGAKRNDSGKYSLKSVALSEKTYLALINNGKMLSNTETFLTFSPHSDAYPGWLNIMGGRCLALNVKDDATSDASGHSWKGYDTNFWGPSNTSDCLFPIYLYAANEGTYDPPAEQGQDILQMFPAAAQGNDATWAFVGGRAVQGTYADIGTVRNFMGQFEEQIRWNDIPGSSGGSTNMQRFTINLGKTGQTLATINSTWDDIVVGKVKPKAAVYLPDPADYSDINTFKTALSTFITNSLALRNNTGFAVIMKPYTTGSNNVTAVNAAIDEVVATASATDAAKARIVVVDSVNLTGKVTSDGYPNAEGHTELAKALCLATLGNTTNFEAVDTSYTISETAAPWKAAFATPDTLSSAQQALKTKMAGSAPLTWLFMGDSITHGAAHLQGHDSIAQSFEKFLKEDLNRPNDIVVNTAISGSKSVHLKDNVTERATKYVPDVVSIMIGTNDSRDGVSKDAFKTNLTTIINAIRASDCNPNAIIILRTPVPSQGNFANHLAEYRAAMQELVTASPSNMILVDQYGTMLPYVMTTGTADTGVVTSKSFLFNKLYTDQQVHPGPVGHLWMTQQFINALGLWDDTKEICQLNYTVDWGTETASSVSPRLTHDQSARTITMSLDDLSTQTGATVLWAQLSATPVTATRAGEAVTATGVRGGSVTVTLPEGSTGATVSIKALADNSGTGQQLTFTDETVNLAAANPPALGELHIEGYTQVKEIPAEGLEHANYLIVADVPDGDHAGYYVLYPGTFGAAANADNVRKLTVDGNMNATGWTKWNSTSDKTFGTADTADFSVANNELSYASDTQLYSATAAKVGASGTTYHLFRGTQQVYQESGPSAFTITAVKDNPGHFYLRNTDSSKHSYLIYFTTNSNFNQNSTLGGDYHFQGDMMLFKSNTPLPEEPEPVEITLANVLPEGYTQLTHAAFDGANSALDETRYYVFLTKDSSGNFYALYPATGAKDVSAGTLGTAGLRTAALTHTTSGQTVTTNVSYLKDNSALTLEDLHFTAEKSGSGYYFTGSTGLKMNMNNNFFTDSAFALSVDKRENLTDAFYIHRGTDRYMNFSKNGDDASGNFTGNVTDFWGPNDAAKDHFPIYIFYKDGAPTAWDKLDNLITECEALDQDAYTQATKAPFATALAEAKTARGDQKPDQPNAENIKTALTKLRTAKEALQPKPTVPETPTATVYVRDTNGLDNNGVYGIFVPHPGDNGNTRLMHDSGTATNQCGASTLENDTKVNIGGCGKSHLWTVATTDNGATVTIQGVASGKYLTATDSNNQLALSDTPVTFTVAKRGNGYTLKNGSKYLAFNSNWDMVTADDNGNTELWFYKETEEELNENNLIKDWKTLVPTPGTTQDQPFISGTGGSTNYRIPAIITLKHQKNSENNGRLVAAIDARWNHVGDACSLDTILSVSDDNGANWKYSFPNYFGDSTNAKASYGTAFIDPELVEAQDGTIYMMTDIYPGGVAINTAPIGSVAATGYADFGGTQRLVLYTTAENDGQTDNNYSYYVDAFEDGYAKVMEIIPNDNAVESGYYVDTHYYLYYDKDKNDALGVDGDKLYCQQLGSSKFVQQNVFFHNAALHVRNTSYLWIVTSKDGGDTWGDPIMVNGQVRTGHDRFYGVGPGAGCSFTDTAGNNVIMFSTYTWSNEISSFIYSLDEGVTWHRGPNATTARSSESALVHLSGNTVRHFFRDNNTTVHYADHTWDPSTQQWTVGQLHSTTAPKQGGFGCQLSAIKYSQKIDGKDAIIVSTPADTGSRVNGKLYVFLVEPNGDTTLGYTYEVTPAGSAYAYSSLTETKDGNIALLYEVSGETVPFKVIPYKDIVPTVTATGFSGPYDGAPHGIKVTVTGGQNVSVQYSIDNATWTDVAPTFADVGTHTVYYKVVGTHLTGNKTVEITQAANPPAITLTADKTILTGEGTIVFTISGLPETLANGDTVTLTYNSQNIALTPGDHGTYTATVHLDGAHGTNEHRTYTATYTSGNYENSATATCEIELRPAVTGATFTVTAQGFNGPYDGQPHGITVVPSSNDVTVTYCETPDGDYTSTSPTRTNAGSTVVYYKAVKGNDASPETIAGSATIFISKVNPPMVIEGKSNYVWDEAGYSFTVKGVPAAAEGTFSLTSSETEVANKTSAPASDGTLTYTAAPHLPEQLRTYTFVAVFEPNENSNYNRFVRTHVVAVTLKEPPALSFNFAGSVSSTPDSPYTGYVTIPFDDADHSPAEFLTFNSNTVSVQYAMVTDDQEPEYSNEAPVFHQAGTYTVSCLGTDKHGELDSKVLTLTVTITAQKIKPNLQLTANPAVLPGGGNITLSLTGIPREGTVELTCDDPSIIIPDSHQGNYMFNLPATVKTYTFTATYTPPAESDSYEAATALCAVTVTAPGNPGGGNGGGSSGGSSAPVGTTNPDGSVTTTTTDHTTGTVTTTTQQPNGSVTVVETQKDGTVTTTDTALSGVVVQTVAKPEADTTVSITVPDGSGDVSLGVSADINYTTVVVNTKTGEIVNLSAPDEELEHMLVKLGESADLVLQDRPNRFEDIQGHWAENAIDFSAAREIFKGTSETQFSPELPMSRAMMVTILARFDGADTTQGDTWYDAGAQWAKEHSISDGSNLDADITREQLVTMLWRYAGCPTTTGTLDDFADADSVGSYAQIAMRWAVKQGIIQGTDTGILEPLSNASRAQVSTIMLRFCRYMVK